MSAVDSESGLGSLPPARGGRREGRRSRRRDEDGFEMQGLAMPAQSRRSSRASRGGF